MNASVWLVVERQRAPRSYRGITGGSLTLDHQPPMTLSSRLTREQRQTASVEVPLPASGWLSGLLRGESIYSCPRGGR